jgi:GDPmannose 4,6-dehydratase
VQGRYDVVGVKRRASTDNTSNLRTALLADACVSADHLHIVEGDITDYASMSGVFTQAEELFGGAPHEVYNLAAQSHVGTSFQQPLATWDSTALGVLNVLEVMRQGGYIPTTRFYQASTSEMFGDNYKIVPTGEALAIGGPGTVELIQDETVAFNPRSPYAVAKVAAHQAVGLYRDAYGLFGCCGILFNHESPRRGENFVTRKISLYVAHLHQHLQWNKKSLHENHLQFPKLLKLGNMAAKRDWGYAPDYVRAMHAMLQHDKPDDYIVATGEAHSVREFCEVAFNIIGENYEDWVTTSAENMRPAEVPHLDGRCDKARVALGWTPTVTFNELVEIMVKADIRKLGG